MVLVEIPQPASFDISFVLANEEKLQRSLLGANYLPGFAAAKKLLAQKYFDERSRIKAEIEAAQAKARADAAPPPDDPPIVVVAKQIKTILSTMCSLDLVREIGTLANSYVGGKDFIERSARRPMTRSEFSTSGSSSKAGHPWYRLSRLSLRIRCRTLRRPNRPMKLCRRSPWAR